MDKDINKNRFRILERDGRFLPQIYFKNSWRPLGESNFVSSLEEAKQIIDNRIEALNKLNKPTIIHKYPV